MAIPSRRARSVLTIHDLHFLRHPERMAAEMRRDFPRRVRQDAARAAAIIVSSAYTAADVVRTLAVPPERVHLCAPGPPRWADAVRAERAGSPPEHILFLGTLEPRKNLRRLVEAVELLPAGRDLVVAGPSGWGPREHRSSSRVRWLGFVDERAEAARAGRNSIAARTACRPAAFRCRSQTPSRGLHRHPPRAASS